MEHVSHAERPDYGLLAEQVRALAEEDPRWMPLLSNASALIYEALPDVNWAGFYLIPEGEGRRVLGPFQGKVACVHIELGRGVCGTAAATDELQLVEDVHAFPGHIACDGASASEVVVPLHADGRVVGVLDIDSPMRGRFLPEDTRGLELVAQALESCAR